MFDVMLYHLSLETRFNQNDQDGNQNFSSQTVQTLKQTKRFDIALVMF